MRTLFNFTILFYILLLGCVTNTVFYEDVATPNTVRKPGQFSRSQDFAGHTAFQRDSGHDLLAMSTLPETSIPLSILNDTIAPPQQINGEGQSASNAMISTTSETIEATEPESAVAKKIVENYLNSKNKEPGGHCLLVSKRRFEEAYKDVYGHSVYQDLPKRMATPYYTPKEVFDFLYVSASGTHEGWRSLPAAYRGKGNAGAISYAGMGDLVDGTEIWSGKLRPGAPMQVWKRRRDYEKVVYGLDDEEIDPFGHSFIFLSYVRDDNQEIIGIKIADQGYQSYRALLPQDYEVWWAVNLTI